MLSTHFTPGPSHQTLEEWIPTRLTEEETEVPSGEVMLFLGWLLRKPGLESDSTAHS